MKLWDYHTHNELCKHAKGKVEEYVQSGIEKGLTEIGIADHFPMRLLPESADVWRYAMEDNEFGPYLTEARRLKQKYKDQITVKIASEVDFFPAAFESYKKALKPYYDELDYIIGSIHVVQWPGVDAWGIDDEKFLAQFRTYGSNKVYLEYLNAVTGMVKTHYYNIVGHMDLPKKFKILPDDPDMIWQKELNLFDELEKTEMSVEINTSGFLKPVAEQYPSERIIKELIQRKISINLGSDSHDPKNVGYNFEIVATLLKKLGCNKLAQWNHHEKTMVTF